MSIIEKLTEQEKSQYIIVKSPDSRLLVAKHRLAYNEEVEKAAKELGLNLKDTAQKKSSHPYIGDITHAQAVKLLLTLGDKPLTLKEFVSFYNLLKKGSKGLVEVYNGNEEQINPKELSVLFDELAGKRDPWRAEHLANSFHKKGGRLHIASEYKLVNGVLKPKKVPLEDCLMKDCYVNLSKVNSQGLPTKKSKKREVFYWSPIENCVAGFGAFASEAVLGCGGYPDFSIAVFGLRRAKIFQE